MHTITAFGALVLNGEDLTARCDFGELKIPRSVYVRSLRLDRRYPNNYKYGYLTAWCEREFEKVKKAK